MMRTYRTAAADSRFDAECFDRLVASLAALDFSAATDSEISAILASVEVDDVSLAPYAAFVGGRYARNGVYRDARFELVVMCWPHGIPSPIHDHGGSRGCVKLLRGSLTTQSFSIVEHDRESGFARLSAAGERDMRPGDLERVIPGNDVHRVGAATSDAVSLHVYAPPLGCFRVFDPATNAARDVAARYDRAPRELSSLS